MTDLKSCRVCGVKTEGWALEGNRYIKLIPAQAWCEKHCLAEFGEHDLYYEGGNMPRYCVHCGWEETSEDLAEWQSDQAQDYYDD